jgi:hypothetical protein
VMGWRTVNDVRDHLIAPEYVLHPVDPYLYLKVSSR